MALESGKLLAKSLFNSEMGQNATNSFSGMLHRGLDKTTETIQQGLQNIKEQTSSENITKSINSRFGGRRRSSSRKMLLGGKKRKSKKHRKMNQTKKKRSHSRR